MANHEELIKRLRACAENSTTRVCLTCPWALHQKGCITAMVTAAADAIEELTEDNAALNGTVANLLEQIKDLASPRWLTDDAEERRRAVQAERDRKARELINAGDFDLRAADSVNRDVWRRYLRAVINSAGDV